MPTKKEIQDIIDFEVINQDDLIFNHSIFCQCFLPIRTLQKKQLFYNVSHGDVSLAIQAGTLVNPDNRNEWEQREVPSGGKSRLLFAYINDYAIRTKSPFIDMTDNLHKFMKKTGIPVCGSNAKEIIRQTKNIAAASIMIGVWGEKKVTQDQIKIVRGISFWLKKSEQGTIVWKANMQLSNDYMAALQHYKVPLDFRSLVGLQANPRAQDVYCWLSYRLRTIKPKVPVKIPYTALHSIFGHGIKNLRNFKIEFKNAIIEAHKFYLTARIEITDKDFVVLRNSPSPIPHKSIIGHGKAMIPRK